MDRYTRVLALLNHSLDFFLSFCNLSLSDLGICKLTAQFLDTSLCSSKLLFDIICGLRHSVGDSGRRTSDASRFCSIGD